MSEMRDLYASIVEVWRLQATLDFGGMVMDWVMVDEVLDPYIGTPGLLGCRLDMDFQRKKDAPMPVVAGRAPDRTGILFCDYTPHLKAGDRIATTYGPVVGTFEIRQVPDVPVDYNSGHHIECLVISVPTLDYTFPGAEPGAEEIP